MGVSVYPTGPHAAASSCLARPCKYLRAAAGPWRLLGGSKHIGTIWPCVSSIPTPTELEASDAGGRCNGIIHLAQLYDIILSQDWTPLFTATWFGQAAVCALLLDQGANLESHDSCVGMRFARSPPDCCRSDTFGLHHTFNVESFVLRCPCSLTAHSSHRLCWT